MYAHFKGVGEIQQFVFQQESDQFELCLTYKLKWQGLMERA